MRGRLKRGRPSPAMIVAVIALIAALTGTAVAALTTGDVVRVVKKYATRSAHSTADPALTGTPGSSPDVALATEITAPRKGGVLHVTGSSDKFRTIADSFSCQIAVDGTLD